MYKSDNGAVGLQPFSDVRCPSVLLVDDQPSNIRALYAAFSTGYRVYMATSGEQALALCKDNPPDLVLLDIVMPGMDGYEVCRRLKADEGTRDIPVIFVTAHNDAENETRGLEAGAVDFIAKPFNPSVVRARVKTHVTLKHQADLLRQMVFIDGLTGVFNRRYFDERLLAEWQRAERNVSPLGLLLIDVDFFKRFNDRYGHQVGDDCLKQVAFELKACLHRPADLVARYGGEEFVCLLPETDFAGAMALANGLEQNVRALKIAHEGSEMKMVTISVGVAAKAPGRQGDAPGSLLALADSQLYFAKNNGRGRACGKAQESVLVY